MMNISVATRQGFETESLLKSCLAESQQSLPKDSYYLAWIFYTRGIEEKVLFTFLKEKIKASHILALKTSKLIVSSGFIHPAISFVLFDARPEEISLFAYPCKEEAEESRKVNKDILKYIKEIGHPSWVLNLIDPTLLKVALPLRNLQNILGTSVPFLGFSTIAEYQYRENPIFYNGRFLKDRILSILFGPQVDLKFSQSTGYNPLGRFFHITKSYGNIIQEIDNIPASFVYRNLGINKNLFTKETIFPYATLVYPLGILLDKDAFCLRHTIKILDDDSLFCNAEIQPSRPLKIMLSTRDDLMKDTVQKIISLKRAYDKKNKKPSLIMIFSSFARALTMGWQCKQEIEAIKKIFAEDIPLIGTLTLREINPVFFGKPRFRTVFQNNSMNFLML